MVAILPPPYWASLHPWVVHAYILLVWESVLSPLVCSLHRDNTLGSTRQKPVGRVLPCTAGS